MSFQVVQDVFLQVESVLDDQKLSVESVFKV